MVISNYLNFYDIFVNQLVGDASLFIFLVLGIVALILVKARAPNQIFTLTIFAVMGMLAVWFDTELRWPLVIFGAIFISFMFITLRRE